MESGVGKKDIKIRNMSLGMLHGKVVKNLFVISTQASECIVSEVSGDAPSVFSCPSSEATGSSSTFEVSGCPARDIHDKTNGSDLMSTSSSPVPTGKNIVTHYTLHLICLLGVRHLCPALLLPLLVGSQSVILIRLPVLV